MPCPLPHSPQGLPPEAVDRIWAVLRALGREVPEETESLWGLFGALCGGGVSFAALWHFGKVKGLTAPGLTSALAELGRLAGGGMTAGLVMIAVPLIAGCMAGYALARRRNERRMAAVFHAAEKELRALQQELEETGADASGRERQALDMMVAVLRQKHKATGLRGLGDHACPPESGHCRDGSSVKAAWHVSRLWAEGAFPENAPAAADVAAQNIVSRKPDGLA